MRNIKLLFRISLVYHAALSPLFECPSPQGLVRKNRARAGGRVAVSERVKGKQRERNAEDTFKRRVTTSVRWHGPSGLPARFPILSITYLSVPCGFVTHVLCYSRASRERCFFGRN